MKKYKEIPLNDEPFEEVMTSDFPRVYIHDMKDNPDDTSSMEISTNKAFDELFKKEKNRKRVSKKGIQEFFIELLEKGLAKEDGYNLRTLKK
jgi:pimeloyl-CoA synthetase